jgi:hypothetical protein
MVGNFKNNGLAIVGLLREPHVIAKNGAYFKPFFMM